MLEQITIYLIYATLIVVFVSGNIIRPYYYYKYSDQYYKNQRWLHAKEARDGAEEAGEKIKTIKFSFIKIFPHAKDHISRFWYTAPPIFFMDLYEGGDDKIDMPRLKLFYLIMCYVSLAITLFFLSVIIILVIQPVKYRVVIFGLTLVTLILNWILIQFTYSRKEKYIERHHSECKKSKYHKEMNASIFMFISLALLLLVLSVLEIGM